MGRLHLLRTDVMDMRAALALVSALLLFATLAGGCAAPAAASAVRLPESVLSFLDAAQSKDLDALLDTIALDEFADGRDATLVMYDVWFASASEMTWEIASVQPRPAGGQIVVVELDALYNGVDDQFLLTIATNAAGRIVSWYAEKPAGKPRLAVNP